MFISCEKTLGVKNNSFDSSQLFFFQKSVTLSVFATEPYKFYLVVKMSQNLQNVQIILNLYSRTYCHLWVGKSCSGHIEDRNWLQKGPVEDTFRISCNSSIPCHKTHIFFIQMSKVTVSLSLACAGFLLRGTALHCKDGARYDHNSK